MLEKNQFYVDQSGLKRAFTLLDPIINNLESRRRTLIEQDSEVAPLKGNAKCYGGL